MPSSSDFRSHARLVTRREALRRGSLFLGSALLGGALLPMLFAETPAEAPAAAPTLPSVDSPDHPIARGRQYFAQAKLEVIRVTDRHSMITGIGGNIGVYVGEDAVLVIDTGSGLPPASEHLREALRSLSDKPVRYVVNTHWHWDHTDGNRNLHGLGATLIAHNTVRARLSSPQSVPLMEGTFPPAPRDALPTITFDQELELDQGSELVHLVHVPLAHTDGDVYVHWPKANVLQTGDLLFCGTYPVIDGSCGGSLEGMMVAEERLLTVIKPDTLLIPGHGPLATRADLTASLEMLRTVQKRLAKLRAEGRSVDEAVAAKPFADLDTKWGGGFLSGEKFLRMLYALKPA